MFSENFGIYFAIGFVAYVVILVLIGTLATRGKRSGKNFLTGGGNIPGILIFASMGASLIGTGSSIGATANGFRTGWGGSAYGLGAALGVTVLVALAWKGRTRSKNFITMAEEAQYYYGGNVPIRRVMSVMMFVIELIWLGNHINGASTYLSFVTGIDPTLAKLIAVAAFSIYVIIGGYLAVVFTDTIQLILLLVGFIGLLVVSIPKAGGWDVISATIIESGQSANLSFYGIGSLGLMGLISLIYTIAIPILGTPTYRTRIYTSKDDKSARRALSRTAYLLLLFSLVPAIIGMAAFTVATRNNVTEVLANPDYAFAFMVTEMFGPILGLFFLIAGLSATMNAGDSDTIAATTILVQDIYPIFTKKEVPEHRVPAVSRILTLVTLALAFFITLFAKDVMGYIRNVIGSIIPGVSIAMILGATWKRVTWQGGMASILSGTLFGILYLTVAPFKGLIVSIFTGPAIPVSLVALVCAVVVSLATAPVEMSHDERMACVVAARGEKNEVLN